jgi:plastocyanin
MRLSRTAILAVALPVLGCGGHRSPAAVTATLDLIASAPGSADGGRVAGHHGGRPEVRTEGPMLAFHGQVRPADARVVVRGAGGNVAVDRRGAFVVRLRSVPPDTSEIALRASAPGRKPWRTAVEVTRGPTGVSPAREPQGAEPDRGSPGSADPSGGKVDVGVRDFVFFPRRVRVRVSQIVVWHNLDHVQHTIVAQGSVPGPDAKRLGYNDRYEFTALRPGLVRYACTIHPWVRGELIVVPRGR